MDMTTESGQDAALLIDGSPRRSSGQLLAHLDSLDIQSSTITHEALRTVEDAKRMRIDLPGAHTKNLFLRNKKGHMWLLTCLEDRALDLKALAEEIGARRLSFGSTTRLMNYLGVIPGAVSPFAVVNDKTNAVTVVLDAALRERSPLNLHPLDNTMTTTLSCADLVRFLEDTKHPPRWFDFDRFALEV